MKTGRKQKLSKYGKGTLFTLSLWFILIVSMIYIGPAWSQGNVTEQTYKITSPQGFARSFTSPENGSLTLKITFEISKGSPNDYEVTYGGSFERGFWYFDSEGEWHPGGEPEGVILILYYNLTCNGHEVGTFKETILAGYGGLGCETLFLRREEDRNVIPSVLMVKGRNLLQLEIIIIITNITSVSKENYSNHYYGIKVKEDFHCRVNPLDRDLDGIRDAVDPLPGINNLIASLGIAIAGSPICMVVEHRLSKLVKVFKKIVLS